MIKCNDWPIAVCTWSVGNDFGKIGLLREQTGLRHINLALAPALDGDKSYLSRVQREGWIISATLVQFQQEDYSTLPSIRTTGGIVPEKYWPQNRKRVIDSIDMTAGLGVKYLLFHFGFIDETDKESFKKFCERVKQLADAADEKGIILLMETGQETASQLRCFLKEMNHPALCVNFDPANMILYDKGNPIDAVKTLAPWVKHIHVKDALRTKKAGTWGTEVPWGLGEVNSVEFLRTLKKINFSGALSIEREAGGQRLDDIKNAIYALNAFTG